MPFEPGSKIRLSSNPAVVATFTGEFRERPGYRLMKVKLPDGAFDFWREHHVEAAPSSVDRMNDFKAGKFGGAEHLQRCLMLSKLRGDLTDIFYSMNSSDIDFFPHQYQPVLKFIESPTKRLLVADEVGLGKTIEAGLIWKEMQARAQASRLLVICPAMLREKWCRELGKRFGIQARQSRASDLLEELTDRVSETSGFALVTGYEAIRPPKSQTQNSARQRLTELLESFDEQDQPLFDLVIVDEAHYARNPDTSTNKIIRLINDRTVALVLLTATPIQLGTENLYELLRLVDPGRFNDPSVFRRLMRSNEPFVKAFYALNRTPPDLEQLKSALNEIESEQSGRSLAHEIRLRMQDAGNLSPEKCVSFARLIERTSMIASSMTRSRKREVLQNRVKRTAQNIEVRLTIREKELYDTVTQKILEKLKTSGAEQISRLVLITRQRQLASCIPAALRSWSQRPELRELLFEDFGISDEDEIIEQAEQELGSKLAQDLASERNRIEADGKLRSLMEIINKRLAEDPSEKIVLFSYFRATLEYLKEQLEARRHKVFLLHGGVLDKKEDVVAKFEEYEGPAILLSSEVGSEGIDLQFCSTLVNYDLPWNPMKVEQRIGRLDRLGQKSPRILIYNLVLVDTIEDRILIRLLMRIGVFERSIGDLEQILGTEVQGLVSALFSSRLTDEEREQQALQNVTAITNRADRLSELEEQASNLFAFTEAILKEIESSKSMKRFLDPKAVQQFAVSLLLRLYPGSSVEEQEHGASSTVLVVDLSAAGKHDLLDFLNSHKIARSTRLCEAGRKTYLTSDPRWKGSGRIRPELIDATHPLLLWLRERLRDDLDLAYPLSAIRVSGKGDQLVSRGTYIYVVDRWQFDGLRKQNKLVYAAIDIARSRTLAHLEAERLILLASESEGEPLIVNDQAILNGAYEKLGDLTESLITAFDDEKSLFETENGSLIERQIAAVRKKAQADLVELESRLANIENSSHEGQLRTVPMIRGRIRAVEERLQIQEAKLSKMGSVSARFSEISAGIIQVV